ncbi:hypothetical protein V7654_13515 [Bacillus sp. JJ1609]|uniref:hypothetical protein n=1 Tax=Bacillus sp. JJ1609 TaxID=3122977 RepID=UPI002FFFB9FB
MSDGLGMALTFILEIILFGLINYYTVKLSLRNVKKRIWGGIIFLLLTPIIFFGTLFFVGIWDEGGWGAGILAVIFTGIYILNGIIMLLSSIHIYFNKPR